MMPGTDFGNRDDRAGLRPLDWRVRLVHRYRAHFNGRAGRALLLSRHREYGTTTPGTVLRAYPVDGSRTRVSEGMPRMTGLP
jgi:hypothetical protein